MNAKPDANPDANFKINNPLAAMKGGRIVNHLALSSQGQPQHPEDETDRRHITALRPLVRYVDERQAVIDVQIAVGPPATTATATTPLGATTARSAAAGSAAAQVELLMQIVGADGFIDEGRTVLDLRNGEGTARFEVVEPQRWWPAGMGEQPLYELTLSLVRGDELVDTRHVTLGLTSIRPALGDPDSPEPQLLVNGQICAVRSILPVDRVDESQLLPATGDSLLLVRDHYGPDLLYQAADRAGILMVQCVPIHPEARPELDVARQVDRLAAHPALAGWFVGHLGRLSDHVAARLSALDPTRNVFRQFPLPVEPAA